MKRIVFTILTFVSSFSIMAQNNYYPATGGVMLGLPSNANYSHSNLHVHTTECNSGGGASHASCTYTTKFTMTNPNTGYTQNKGFVIHLEDNDIKLSNYSYGGTFLLNTGGVNIFLQPNIGPNHQGRYGFGFTSGLATNPNFGRFNFNSSSDNGIYVETSSPGKFGISFKSAALTDNAIQVMGTDGQSRNFSVKANGYVYARKYTTTLNNIPDYVFLPSYKLMSFTDLRTFVNTNHHLPNVPSANDYQQNGVDLGEMNRILLEKTEELTLYILQLEERLKKLEDNQNQQSKE